MSLNQSDNPTNRKLAFALLACAACAAATPAFAGGGVCSCATDLNTDGATDAADLAILLGGWGAPGLSDLDANGVTDAADLAIQLGAWGPCAAPSNDDCGGAILLEGETVVQEFCNASATDSPVAFPTLCDNDRAAIGKDMWYRYVSQNDGKLIVNTLGSQFDTVLGVYRSFIPTLCGCPGGQFSTTALIACDDDIVGTSSTSSVEFDVAQGDCLNIRVGGYKAFDGNVDEGPGLLTIQPIKRGDRCDIAHELPEFSQLEVLGTNAGDTWLGGDVSSCALNDTHDEWYRVVPQCTGGLYLTTCDPVTDFDTTLSAYLDCDGVLSEIACNDDSTSPGCQIGELNRKSEVSFVVNGGQPVYIRVSGYQGAVGNFKLFLLLKCVG